MTLKKTIWTVALYTGFIGALLVTSPAIQTATLAAAVEIQAITPPERGPHVLPPF